MQKPKPPRKRKPTVLQEIRAATPRQPIIVARWKKRSTHHTKCANAFLQLHGNHGGTTPPMLPPWQCLPPTL